MFPLLHPKTALCLLTHQFNQLKRSKILSKISLRPLHNSLLLHPMYQKRCSFNYWNSGNNSRLQYLTTKPLCHIWENTFFTILLLWKKYSAGTFRITHSLLPHHWFTLIQTSELLPLPLQMNCFYLQILVQSLAFYHLNLILYHKLSIHIQLIKVLQLSLPIFSAHYLHQVLLPVVFSQDYQHNYHLIHHQEHYPVETPQYYSLQYLLSFLQNI